MILSLAILPLLLLVIGTPVFLAFLTAVVVTMIFVLPLPPVALQQVLFGGSTTTRCWPSPSSSSPAN